MGNLILNRVGFSLSGDTPSLFLSKEPTQVFHLLYSNLSEKLKKSSAYKTFSTWVGNDFPMDSRIYFGFTHQEDENTLELKLNDAEFKYFKPKYVRETLIRHFQQNNFVVDPFPAAIDMSLYEKIGAYNNEWSSFRRYDLVIKGYRDELSFSVGSNNTIISNVPIQITEEIEHTRSINPDTGFICPAQQIVGKSARIVANRQERVRLGVSNTHSKISYKNTFKTLQEFYHAKLLSLTSDNIRFDVSGLRNVAPRDQKTVNMQDNKMLFGKEQTDVNAVTGMRDYGPYKTSPKASENKFIFIYENRDDANNLYQYFKNGLKHFPGLWSYVGIPATLDLDVKLKYTNENTLRKEFDIFLESSLPDDKYDDYFAIIIGPFTKQDADEEESFLYYHIKERLLRKGIASQFISYKSIRSGSFHYFLPNIAVAMLAKLGGVPWRLLSKRYDELVIGFNQKVIGDKRLIGSAVFFSNEGELGAVVSYPQSESEMALVAHLRNSIEKYIKDQQVPPSRLIIHYFKPHSESEKKSIEDLIYNEFKLNIPFAIVEVNDSKSSTDICFDPDFDMGMPESGTYVMVGKNEYLLFNNTRYQKNPVRSIVEELPVKVKIHFADSGGFSHHELIGQVYEFSRLYWKGLKQRSQPVTTIYSKLVAEFASHFEGVLPDNEITQNTPWFL